MSPQVLVQRRQCMNIEWLAVPLRLRSAELNGCAVFSQRRARIDHREWWSSMNKHCIQRRFAKIRRAWRIWCGSRREVVPTGSATNSLLRHSPTFGSRRRRDVAIAGIRIIGVLTIVGHVGGCSSLLQQEPIIAVRNKTLFTANANLSLETRFTAVLKAAGGGATAFPIDAGIAYSDGVCNDFLNALNKADQNSGIAKDATTLVGTGLIAIAGFNGASAESLGKGAAGLTASSGLFDSFRARILLAPASDIGKKVQEYRQVKADLIREAAFLSGDRQVTALLEYHDTCSPRFIRALVSEALAAVAYEAPTLPDPVNAVARAAAEQAKSELHFAVEAETGSYSDDLLRKAYAVLLKPEYASSKPVSEYGTLHDVKVLTEMIQKLESDDVTKPRYRKSILLLKQIGDTLGFDANLAAAIEKEAREAGEKRLTSAIANSRSTPEEQARLRNELSQLQSIPSRRLRPVLVPQQNAKER